MYLLIDVKAGPFDEQCEKEKWKRVEGDTRSYLLPNSHDAHLPARIGDRIAVFMGSECAVVANDATSTHVTNYLNWYLS